MMATEIQENRDLWAPARQQIRKPSVSKVFTHLVNVDMDLKKAGIFWRQTDGNRQGEHQQIDGDMSMLTVDDLRFELKRSGRRKTMQITVERDGQLIIMAPPDVSEEGLSAFVRQQKILDLYQAGGKGPLASYYPKKAVQHIN